MFKTINIISFCPEVGRRLFFFFIWHECHIALERGRGHTVLSVFNNGRATITRVPLLLKTTSGYLYVKEVVLFCRSVLLHVGCTSYILHVLYAFICTEFVQWRSWDAQLTHFTSESKGKYNKWTTVTSCGLPCFHIQ